MRVSNVIAEQIVRSGGASCNQRTFALFAADVLDHRARIAKLESIIKTLHEELKDRYYVREDCGGYDPSYQWFDRLEELMEEKGIQL